MITQLTNLLPRDRQQRTLREYYLRLATIAVSALAVVIALGIVLLAPSFIYLQREISSRKSEIATLAQVLSAPAGQSASSQLQTLAASATYLTRLGSTTSASGALSGILSVSRDGVTLTSLTFSPPVGANAGTMTLAGQATTRESLRAYVSALSALPYVSNANLPISDYAEDANIPFTITLTGSLKPSP